MTRILTALVHQEGNLFVADCPEIGTASQGHSLSEAVTNLIEATDLYLEVFPLDDDEATSTWQAILSS
jgi:predicted RNase H-like HicB family nuclease